MPTIKRPHTTAGHLKYYISAGGDQANPFRCGSSINNQKYTPLSFHGRDFKNVETFNVNPGYKLAKSNGRMFAKINTKDFFDHPKPPKPEKKQSVKEMEGVIVTLREQVSSLSADLQDERARHAGSRKRAALDREQLEADLKEKHRRHVLDIKKEHAENIAETIQQYEGKIAENEAEANVVYEKLRTEYGLLQASFKNFTASTQEDLKKELEMKQDEWEWNKKRAVDDANDRCKADMEKKFTVEREQIKKEFLSNIETLMKKQREEISEIHKKYTDGSMEIEDLRERSEKLDVVEAELAEVKEKFEEEKKVVKRLKRDLDNTTCNLRNLEQQFEERVSAVDDKHRAKIQSLLMDRADAHLKLAKSCEELQSEKMARELAEDERKEAARNKMEDKIRSTDERIKSALKSSQKTQKKELPQPVTELKTAAAVAVSEEKKPKSVSFVTFDLEDGSVHKNYRSPHPRGYVADEIPEIRFDSVDDVATEEKKTNRILSAPIKQPPRFSVPPMKKAELRPSTVSLALKSGHSPYPRPKTAKIKRTRSPSSRSRSPDTMY